MATIAAVAPFAALPAFASAPSGASLALSSTASAATGVTATNIFTSTSGVNAAGKICIESSNNAAPGTAADDVTLSSTLADYTVTYGSSSTATQTTDAPTAVTVVTGADACSNSGVGSNPVSEVTVTNAIPSGQVVTVTIKNNTNPTVASGSTDNVYFRDSTTGDTTPTNTNSVAIAVPPAPGQAAVSDVNPRALPGGAPFTITGSSFNNSVGTPEVCFVATGTTPPASGTTPCGTAGTGYMPATGVTYVSATELEAVSPTGINSQTSNTTYDVVVYNETSTTGPAFSAPSTTSSNDQVTGVANLDFVPQSGVRVADSRSGFNLPAGAVPSGGVVAFPFANIEQSPALDSNIPSSATAVSLNVTGVAPSGVGNLQVWAAGTCTKNAVSIATVNFQPGQDTNNNVIVPVGANTDLICVQDNGASVNVVMDATGYTTAYTAENVRVLDTRPTSQVGSLKGPLPGGQVFSVQLPATYDSTTVALNVAAVAPTMVGNLRVFPEPSSGPPAPSAVPNTAVVNYIPNTDASSFYITAVPANGKIDIYSDTSGTVNVVIDVYGIVTSTYVHVLSQPYRVCDTRPSGIAAGTSFTCQVSNTGSSTDFTPLGAVGTIGTLSDIAPASVGYVVAYPAGTPTPATASLANYPGQTRIDDALVALSPTGAMDIYAGGSSTNSTWDASAYIS
ncbi:MAG: hypothetical protein ACYCO3_14650 [Mycobacteriales bacterium]